MNHNIHSIKKGGITMLDKIFKLKANNTSVLQEFYASLATFTAMAYIIIVNPDILSAAGMDKGAVFTATILATAFSSILIGLYANIPLALAPGMGTNAWFAFGIVLAMGNSWQSALGAVFVSGILITLFSLSHLRTILIEAIPETIKNSIAVGIGVFIAFIGFRLSGIAVSNNVTFITLGDYKQIGFILAIVGLLSIGIFEILKIKASVILSIFLVTAISYFTGHAKYHGFVSAIPSLKPTFGQLDLSHFFSLNFIMLVLVLFIADFTDSTSTFISASKLLKRDLTKDKKMKKGLIVDGIASIIGSIFGTSTVVPYVESNAGISSGAKTGLTSIFVGLLFMTMFFFSPLLSLIPSFAVAHVLIYIGILMMKNIIKINWEDITEAIPAFLTIFIMPVSSSIVHGFGIGAITWIILNTFTKKVQLKKHYMLLLMCVGYLTLLIVQNG